MSRDERVGVEFGMRNRFLGELTTTLGLAPLCCLGLALSLGGAHASAQEVTLTVSNRALAAIELPYAAIELRAAGVPAPEVQTIIVEARRAELPVTEVVVLFDHSVEYVYVHGPVPRFGDYVRLRLGEGLRGPRLYGVMRGHYEEHGHHPPGLALGHHRRWHPHGHFGGRPHGVRVRGPGGGGHGFRGGGGNGHVRVRGGGGGGVRVHRGGGGGRVRVRGGGGGGGVRVRGGGGGHGGGGRGGGGHGGGGRGGGHGR